MRKFFTPRNIILIIVVLVAMIGSAVLLKVPLPTIVLPAEKVFTVAGIPVTNTFFATVITDVILILLAIFATRKMKDIPSGLQNLIEWFVEGFHNLSVDVAGKANAARFFPLFMTILMFVLVANWMGLVPGVDSIGKLEPLETAYEIAGVTTGYKIKELPLSLIHI